MLKRLGLTHIRTEGSHEIWDKRDGSLLRPIVIKRNCKDVPELHIHTSLHTLGISKKEFLDLLEKLR